jgi:hypothetical protein
MPVLLENVNRSFTSSSKISLSFIPIGTLKILILNISTSLPQSYLCNERSILYLKKKKEKDEINCNSAS